MLPHTGKGKLGDQVLRITERMATCTANIFQFDVDSTVMVSLSRFDAALQKARKERAVKRRGTFKRANKNRYTLPYKLPTFTWPDDG